MPAERSVSGSVAWVLGAVLLTVGCAGVPQATWGDTRGPRPEAQASPEPQATGPLRRRHSERRRGTELAPREPEPVAASEPALAAEPPLALPVATEEPLPAVPEGWPDLEADDEALLAPLLKCTSVAQFLALQRGVDMAPLVEKLRPWSAVRLGALGPLEAHASQVLQRKRVAFLLEASLKYRAHAEVFALFLVHTAHDDELRQVLQLLARDKQLSQTLGPMPAVRQELERRGLRLEDFPERQEQAGDVLRGLARAGEELLSTSPVVDGARGAELLARLAQLPPAYGRAYHEQTLALLEEHYTPGTAVRGAVDEVTLGVPLGFYHLVASLPQGASSVLEGRYEQAARELAPAALLAGLYTGGKGLRALGGARGVARGPGELAALEVRLQAVKEVAERLRQRLGEQGLGELARYLQAQREAALLVGAGGEPAAVALYEARGDVARAQAWLSQARPPQGGAPAPPGLGGGGAGRSARAGEAASPSPRPGAGSGGGLASLVDETVGFTPEVVEAKLLRLEWETAGPRLPADVALLHKLEATLSSPPPGVPQGYVLWSEYLTYRRQRLAELKAGQTTKGPLRWEAYERMRGLFAQGLAFERAMVQVLREDAALPPAQRQWLQDFQQPRIEVHVGMAKPGVPGVRFADVLVIEELPPQGQPPRVETLSFKSRNLSLLKAGPLRAQIEGDARAALDYYGGTVDIRRPALQGSVEVRRVRLVYQGGTLLPKVPKDLEEVVNAVREEVPGVEVLVQ